jgi:hypothetical protein
VALRLADAFFGGRDDDVGASGHWALRFLGVAALLAAIVVGRRPDAITTPQFWAEDSTIFFLQNLQLGFPRALANFYRGYPDLAQRLIAFLGGLVPLAHAPLVYTTSAIAISALALASFSLPCFRHLVRHDELRILWGIAAASLPAEQELLSTPTNVGWYVAIWFALLSVMRLPRQPWQLGLLVGAGTVAIFTTPLTIITLPLWLLRGFRAVQRGDRRELACAVVFLAAMAVVVVFTTNLGAERGWFAPGTPLEAFRPRAFGVLQYLFHLVVYRCASLVLPPSWCTGAVGAAAALAVPGALVAAAWAARWRTLPGIVLALALATASLLAVPLGRPLQLLLPAGPLPSRYEVFPGAMLTLGVAIALDGVPEARSRTALTLGCAALFAWAWRSGFVVPPFEDLQWPSHAARLETKLRTRSPEPLTIPINPRLWGPLRFDHGSGGEAPPGPAR